MKTTDKNESVLSAARVRVAILCGAAIAALALSACNTVSGAGKDLQEASDNVKDAIED
jgi:predicted small secreted protein